MKSDYIAASTQYIINVPPKAVGYWILPGSSTGSEFRINMIKRPCWFHRWTMFWFLGWKWRDTNE